MIALGEKKKEKIISFETDAKWSGLFLFCVLFSVSTLKREPKKEKKKKRGQEELALNMETRALTRKIA